MSNHKLEFDEFDEIDYDLIAIHTPLEDYRLAYSINQQLFVKLSKSKNQIHIKNKNGETSFSRFYYFDTQKSFSWDLIQNKNEIIQNDFDHRKNLFSETKLDVLTPVHLVPEFKKVDYFLKIEQNTTPITVAAIQVALNSIKNISMVYKIDTNKIKSKNNLIF